VVLDYDQQDVLESEDSLNKETIESDDELKEQAEENVGEDFALQFEAEMLEEQEGEETADDLEKALGEVIKAMIPSDVAREEKEEDHD